MELEPPGPLPRPEGLVRNRVAGGQKRRPGGEIERVVVPLEHQVAVPVDGEEAVVARIPSGTKGVEPHLADGGGTHGGPERPGEQLAAEADPQHRKAAGDRLRQQPALAEEERVVLGLLHVHPAAEDDEARAIIRGGEPVPFVRVEVSDLEPGRGQDLLPDAQVARGLVPDADDGLQWVVRASEAASYPSRRPAPRPKDLAPSRGAGYRRP